METRPELHSIEVQMLPAGRWNALSMRAKDVRVVQRAGPQIADLGADLDRQLGHERRPAERMRMLRETTNRITRIANDAVNAYQRASRAVSAELAKPNGNSVAARHMRLVLDTGRFEVLRALEMERHRYPWTDVAGEVPADGAEDPRIEDEAAGNQRAETLDSNDRIRVEAPDDVAPTSSERTIGGAARERIAG